MSWGVMEIFRANRIGPRGRADAKRAPRSWPLAAAAWLVVLGASVALPFAASAQFAFLDPPRGQLERTHEIDVHVDGEFGADIDRGTSFNRLNTGVRYTTDGALNRNFGLGLHIAYMFDGYNFDDYANPTCAPDAPCFEVAPWQNVHTTDIAPSVGIIFTPGFQLLAWVPMRFSHESGRSESPFTGGIVGAARIVFDQGRIATTLGVGYMSELEASGRVFPVIGVDWQVGERWRFLTEGGPYEGGLGTVVFGPASDIKLRVSAGWERKRFRLSDSGDRSPNGLGQHVNAPILAGLDIRLSDAFHLEFHGGLSVAGHVTILDSDGNTLLESDYDVAGRFGGSLQIVF